MPNLSNADLGELRLYLPPIDRQQAVVEAIDALHAETHRLESIYQQKLATLDELKKSLLHQAFSGEL
jgi:type I restriction enzyme, S subunit